jgi:tetratricopeptide (TPR) repeat protein
MAPEQARGEASVGAAADVFALGAVLYRALVGHAPFVGADMLAVLLATVLETPARPSEARADVPPELDDLVMAMLARAPEDRPRALSYVRAELERARMSDAERPPPSRALTTLELRLMSVVVVRPTEHDATTASVGLRAIVAPFGGEVQSLRDGTLFVALGAEGAATDHAVRAARCALSLRAKLPDAAIGLATGRGSVDQTGTPIFDRLTQLTASASVVGIDEVTAGLLDARFEVGSTSAGFTLVAERPLLTTFRTLLGKPSPCVGREREIATIEGIFEECVGEPSPRKVLVAGDAGIGKSRIRAEILRRLCERDERDERDERVEIWIGRGDPVGSGSPFALLAGALMSTSGVCAADPIAARREQLLARVRRHVPEEDVLRVAAFLGESIGTQFPEDAASALPAAWRDPTVMADQIARAWYELIAAECAAQPLVIVLEDLHWGDRASVQLITSALRALERAPLFVLAFGRPEAREAFPEFTVPSGAEEIALRPLAKRASEELVLRALGERATKATTARLVELSQGNPFFLEELIRAEAEGRSDTAPGTVLAMLEARLASLDPSARRLLRAASVFGSVFWSGALVALVGRRAAGFEAAIRALTDAELISVERGARVAGEAQYRFRHALVREAAYATLTEDDAREGHALAGAWLEQNHAADARSLATHFDRGALPLRAASHYHRAALQALEGNDAAAARDLSAQALRAMEAGEGAPRRVGDMMLLHAEAHAWLSALAPCEESALGAAARLEVAGPAWFAAQRFIVLASGSLGHAETLAAAREAIVATVATGDAIEERQKGLHAVLAQHWFRGDVAAWRALGREVEATATTSPALLARLERERARAANLEGDLSAAAARMQRGAELATEAGDLRYAAMMSLNAANAYTQLGKPERAEPILRELLARTAFGLEYLVCGVEITLAHALLDQRDFEGARAHAMSGLARVAGDRRSEGGGRTYLAQALAGTGALREAEAEARRAVELLSIAPPLRPRAHAALANILLERGRPAEAREAADSALADIAKVGVVEEGDALARLALVQALVAMGEDEAANQALRGAREALLARAKKLHDDDDRRTFLERVPEHRETLALAAARLGS